MKKKILITFLVLILINLTVLSQNIGINTSGTAPNSKALLDIDAIGMNPKGGLLIPRMSTTERDAITPTIPEALLIYNTTTQCFEAYNATSSQWVGFGCIGCQLPGSFSASAASNLQQTSFSANWTASSGATGYYLDVSTNISFSSFVTGYYNLNVNNVTTYSVSSLTCNTTYYYRVRAYNACGPSSNSNVITVNTSSCVICNPIIDGRDSKTYSVVLIGSQCWMAQNLNYGNRINGSLQQQNNSLPEKYCYSDLETNCDIYGGLYQWAEMVQYTNGATNSTSWSPVPSGNVQGICPNGWHLPTDDEWCTLENTVEAGTDPGCNLSNYRGINVGGSLKEAGTSHWSPSNTCSPTCNTTGFSGLPGGFRLIAGTFMGINGYSYFWSRTEATGGTAKIRSLEYNQAKIYRADDNKPVGFIVRCVKD